MIERTITKNLKTALFKGKAILLIGPRQVGKTTLLHFIANEYKKPYLWLNADESDIALKLENTTSTELKALIGQNKLVIVDEAQVIKNIGKTLKLITDSLKDVQVIATGSSAFELRNKMNEPLTGRKNEFNLYPITIAEMNANHGELAEGRLLEHRLIYGFYPEVINNIGEEQKTLRDLSGSYLYKDLLMIDGIKKASMLDKLLQALALQLGNEVSYTELAQLLGGVDPATVEKYIDLLEKSFVVFKLPALSRNHRNEIKKGKKIYFWDNGIRNAIIKNFQPLELRTDKGALWENFLISERLKQNSYNGNWVNSYFWRTFDGSEIDYIEEKDGKMSAYEFKWNAEKKKVKLPGSFSDSYENSEFRVIDKNNYGEFV
jgi:predicted AAA+ superfamily ATPase